GRLHPPLQELSLPPEQVAGGAVLALCGPGTGPGRAPMAVAGPRSAAAGAGGAFGVCGGVLPLSGGLQLPLGGVPKPVPAGAPGYGPGRCPWLGLGDPGRQCPAVSTCPCRPPSSARLARAGRSGIAARSLVWL